MTLLDLPAPNSSHPLPIQHVKAHFGPGYASIDKAASASNRRAHERCRKIDRRYGARSPIGGVGGSSYFLQVSHSMMPKTVNPIPHISEMPQGTHLPPHS